MAKAKRKPSKTEADLVSLFEASDKRIESLLSKVLDRIGNSDDTPTMTYLRRYQAQIRAILKRLKKDSARWVDDIIPRTYKDGVASADSELNEAGIDFEENFGRIHVQSVKVLSEATGTRFSDAIDVIGRRADDVFRTVQLDAVAGSVMGYESIQQTTRRLKADLLAKGLTTFKDAAGRNWSMRNYADMAARTVTMEAQNRGRWNEFAAHDEDMIVVSSHPMTCPKCEPWQGKVLSITGKTPGYPTVAEAKEAGLWHPRCRHSFALWVEEEAEEENKAPEFVPAKTRQEAEKWAVTNGLGKKADYKGIDIEVINTWNEGVYRNQKIFPKLKGSFDFIGSSQSHYNLAHYIDSEDAFERLKKKYPNEDDSQLRTKALQITTKHRVSGEYAFSWNKLGARGVSVNGKWGKDPRGFALSLEHGVKTKWHPVGCDKVKSVVDHEMGHQIDKLVGAKMDPDINHLFRDTMINGMMKDDLSEYAERDLGEFIAESWSEYMNNPTPRPIAQKVAERLLYLGK
ncbi:MAG: phage minor capsid protein [Candidatus Omnitrophota bacterium]|jgi:hypothetical protein